MGDQFKKDYLFCYNRASNSNAKCHENHMKITEAQVEASCRIASAVYAGSITTTEGIDELVSKHQVNRATAHDFIYDYKRLTQGKLFQRAMSAQAMTYFIEEIASTHGMSGLANAIESLWSHIHYYEGHTKTTMHKMRSVVTGFESRLPKPGLRRLTDVQADLAHQVAQSLSDSTDARNKRLITACKVPQRIEVRTTIYIRNPDVVAAVLDRADGFCERCKSQAPFIRVSNGTPYLEVHHRIQLADGGEDSTDNAIAICPNCHRELHYGPNAKRKNIT